MMYYRAWTFRTEDGKAVDHLMGTALALSSDAVLMTTRACSRN